MSDEILDDHTVIGRALAVIEAVIACGSTATLADLARLTGIPKPTALRIASDLVQRRLLRRNPNGYSLGPELSRLGETASLQREFDRYIPVLEVGHAAHGGVAWLTAGRELIEGSACRHGVRQRIRGHSARRLACSGSARCDAVLHRLRTPRSGASTNLLERVARGGMAPSTTQPHSLREVSQLLRERGSSPARGVRH